MSALLKMVGLSRAQILTEYFDWWSDQMRKAGKANLISTDNCVRDWIETHFDSNYAEKVIKCENKESK